MSSIEFVRDYTMSLNDYWRWNWIHTLKILLLFSGEYPTQRWDCGFLYLSVLHKGKINLKTTFSQSPNCTTRLYYWGVGRAKIHSPTYSLVCKCFSSGCGLFIQWVWAFSSSGRGLFIQWVWR